MKIVFAILVASFAVWGIGDSFFFGGETDTVAEIGDRQITANELSRAFRSEVQRLQPLNIDEQRARQLGVLDQVLDRLISETLFDAAANDLGMTVGEDTLRRQIRQRFGNIGPAQFENVLRQNGVSEQQYVALLGLQLMRGQYLQSITLGTRAPNALVDKLYAWRGEKRSASIVTVPVDNNAAVREPTEEEVEAYYKAQAADFTAPEYRALSFVFLDPAKIAKEIRISDDRLRKVFDDRLEALSIPEKRTLLQLLAPDRATADKALDRLRAGEDFIAVAKDVAGQDESATRLGAVTQRELPAQLAKPAFALEKGKFSEPIDGPFGLQILQVTEIVPGETPSYEEAREQLRTEVADEEAIDSVLEIANRLEEALGGGGALADAAQDFDLEIRKVGAIDREGRNRSDAPIPGLPGPPFLQVAFETPSGEESFLSETAEGGFFVIRVDSVTPPALRPLDEVRAEAIADWKAEERWKAARERAAALVKRLGEGAKTTDIAKEAGLSGSAPASFTRNGDGAPASMPSSLVSEMFSGPAVGHAAMADGPGGVAIAQLTGIEKAAADTDKDGVEALTRTLRRGIADDIAAQLGNALRERHAVSVNENALRYHFYPDAGES